MSDSAFGRIEGSPPLRALYQQLLDLLDTMGSYQVQHHKSSVHLLRRTGFVSVTPAEAGLRLVFRGGGSANSGADEVTVTSPTDFDDLLGERLAAAYRRAE